MSSIFRKEALKKLSSPDQLDKRINLIGRGGIFGLIAILLLIAAGLVWAFTGTVTTTVHGSGILTNDSAGVKVVAAAQEGIVKTVFLNTGDQVKSGDPIVCLSQDGKEVEVNSLFDGEILELRVTEGEFVPAGTTVALLTNPSNNFVVMALFPAAEGKLITEGMQADVVPSIVKPEEYGSMPGKILSVSERPVSSAEVQAFLQDEELVELLTGGEPPIMVIVEVQTDSSSASGFKWGSGTGPPFLITSGTISGVEVSVDEQTPITLLFPFLKSILGQ